MLGRNKKSGVPACQNPLSIACSKLPNPEIMMRQRTSKCNLKMSSADMVRHSYPRNPRNPRFVIRPSARGKAPPRKTKPNKLSRTGDRLRRGHWCSVTDLYLQPRIGRQIVFRLFSGKSGLICLKTACGKARNFACQFPESGQWPIHRWYPWSFPPTTARTC